jgi:hypothetical protein
VTATSVAALPAAFPHLALPGPGVVADLVLSCLRGSGGLRPGRREEVVVFAVDGIAAPVLERACAAADQFTRYRAAFPSTSLVSWLAAIGLRPGCHPVTGPVLRVRPGYTSNYIADSEASWAAGEQQPAEESRDSRGCPPFAAAAAPTMFQELAGLGLTSEVLIGDFLGISEAWIALLTAGAERHDPLVDLDPLRLSPARMASAAVAGLRARQEAGRAACRWVYVNFDDHIHRHGYSDELTSALQHIAATARDLAAAGYTVLVHSDHGHIRNVCEPGQMAAWASVENPRYCTAPAGGAGRVRWLYPRPHLAEVVRVRLRDALGEDAAVFARDSAQWDEFARRWAHPTLTGHSVGEVVAVALTERFPVPDARYVFEHGSVCEQEMVTGVAAWAGH